MPFSGLSSNELFDASLYQRDVADIVRGLSLKEIPLLDFLGDSGRFARQIKHEFVEDQLLPNYITNSTVINSATANTAFQVSPAGIGNALNVGQILENESAAPELMQVVSIVPGGNSIVVSRGYSGAPGTIGSLAPGGSIYVREAAGLEGADHSGADTRRAGNPRANTVGLFRMELAASGTQIAIEGQQLGNDTWEGRKAKGLIDILHQLEKAVIRGKTNASSLGSTTATRTMQGLREQITTINSTITSSSFVANPHLYLSALSKQVWKQGGSDTESWAVIAGADWHAAMSDLNDTKVQDSNKSEVFQRRIRTYGGAFAEYTLLPSRVMPDASLMMVPRERVQVVPLNSRSFNFEDMAKAGDNQKGLWVGEYTVEVYHPAAMARAQA